MLLSLAEAARLTGLDKAAIVRLVHSGKVRMEKGPDGKNGVVHSTLLGVNGYAPPKPPPEAKRATPPADEPPPLWYPTAADIVGIVKLDDRGRGEALAALIRKHPHLRAWFSENPLPPVFKRQPPPPPPAPPPPPPPLPEDPEPAPPKKTSRRPEPKERPDRPSRPVRPDEDDPDNRPSRTGLILIALLVVSYCLYRFVPWPMDTPAYPVPSPRIASVPPPNVRHWQPRQRSVQPVQQVRPRNTPPAPSFVPNTAQLPGLRPPGYRPPGLPLSGYPYAP